MHEILMGGCKEDGALFSGAQQKDHRQRAQAGIQEILFKHQKNFLL